jgi:hyperosmotically inducible protein
VGGDMWLTAETKMRLMSDERIPALDINVDSRDGVVTLFGYVHTPEEKAAAEEVVQQVAGVQRVDNALEVVSESDRAAATERDEDVDRMVEQAVKSDPVLKDDRVDVEVKNGVARLTGAVDSEGERYAAAWTARSVRGVRAIKNDLTVEGSHATN